MRFVNSINSNIAARKSLIARLLALGLAIEAALLLPPVLAAPAAGSPGQAQAGAAADPRPELPFPVRTLDQGSAFIAGRDEPIVLDTPYGKLFCQARSVVYILSHPRCLTVFTLDAASRDDVRLISGNQVTRIAPGVEMVATSDKSGVFQQVNPQLGIAFRNLRKSQLANGTRIFQTEFSIPSALRAIKPLRDLSLSSDPADKRLVRSILKNAAIMGPVSFARPESIPPLGSTTAQAAAAGPAVLQGAVSMSRQAAAVRSSLFEFDELIDMRMGAARCARVHAEAVQAIRMENGSWHDLVLEGGPGRRAAPASENNAAVVTCERDTLIKTHGPSVLCRKGTAVLVVEEAGQTAVYAIGAAGVSDVHVVVRDRVLPLRPGKVALVSNTESGDFTAFASARGIGFKNPQSQTLGDSTVSLADFSIPGAMFSVPPLRRLACSPDSADRRMTRDILKSAAILHDLSWRDGPYKLKLR